MRVIVSGNNDVACSVLEGLIKSGEQVVGINPEGRDIVKKNEDWERPFQPLAEKFGEEKNIPCFVGNVNKFSYEIESLRPDLIAFCRGICLVKPAILKIPSRGCTNLHYGELPRYGGCATIQWAVLNGEDHVGVTLHYMTPRFDDGPIIDQRLIDITGKSRSVNINEREIEVKGLTAFEIYQEANKVAAQMFLENYPLVKSGKARAVPQDISKRLYFSSDQLNFSKDKYIELDHASDEEISRHVRAFTFPPKQLPIGRINGKEYGDLVLR